MDKVKLSICIPCFNKTKELETLLKSIENQENKSVEIVICEDLSPERESIIQLIELFKSRLKKTKIKFYLNEKNYGYDKNLRNTIDKSSGEYVMLCGNDDIINPKAINTILTKIKKYKPTVIVRSYESFNEIEGKEVQIHRYVRKDLSIENKSSKELAWLFYRSVLVSGLVLNAKLAKKYSTQSVDGFLYYQNYISVCLFMEGNILYVPDLIVKNRLMPAGYFGTAAVEKNAVTIPGKRTIDSSINQMKNFFKCAEHAEKMLNEEFVSELKKIAAAYSLPLLSYHIDKGNVQFINYIINLRKIGYSGIYFYLYAMSLIIFRKKLTIYLIIFLKNFFGHTVKLV